MSHPKSGSIKVTRTLTHADLLREAERQKRHNERRAQEKRDAEKRNMARREEARQRAFQVAADRAKRRLEMEKRREEAQQRAENERLQRRFDAAHKVTEQLKQESKRLQDLFSGMNSDMKALIDLQPPVLPPTPSNAKDVQLLEQWCSESERMLAEYSKSLQKVASDATISVGKQDLIKALSKGIAFEVPRAEPLIAAFEANRRDQTDASLQKELDRVLAVLKSGSATFESPVLPLAMREQIRSSLATVSQTRNLRKLRDAVGQCTALFASAQVEVDARCDQFARLNKILQDWEELEIDVPPELRDAATVGSNLAEAQIESWETRFSHAKAQIEQEREEILQQQREADRLYITTALQQTLENLGYKVDTIDHSLFVDGGNFYATRPEWNGHFVEISGTTVGDADRLKTRCVRTPLANTRLDAQVDVRWTEDIHKAMRVLSDDRGIELDIDHVDKHAPLVASVTAKDIATSPLLQSSSSDKTLHATEQSMPIPRKG